MKMIFLLQSGLYNHTLKLFHMENQQLQASIEREIQARQQIEQEFKDSKGEIDEQIKFDCFF